MPVLPDVASRITLPGVELPGGDPFLDHPQRRPILHRAAGVLPLGLRVQLDARQVALDPAQANERRVADEVDNRGADAWRERGNRHVRLQGSYFNSISCLRHEGWVLRRGRLPAARRHLMQDRSEARRHHQARRALRAAQRCTQDPFEALCHVDCVAAAVDQGGRHHLRPLLRSVPARPQTHP